jgi:AraC-like DNA-binding protein
VQTSDVERAACFLAAHVTEPVRLDDVADHVGYSPFHLARSFQRHLGTPPGRFLAAHRFQEAKRLLLTGEGRVIDVCHAAGFSAPGTFATRFTELVGATPTDFRRLPEVLAGSPPRPVVVPGPGGPGEVVGEVDCTDAASALLGPAPALYVGLFGRRAARGAPVAGALLQGPGAFRFEHVPAGTYYVLAAAIAARAPYDEQLVPVRTVAGSAATPVLVGAAPALHRRDVVVDALPAWSSPVLVALPLLASPAGPGWKRKIGDDATGRDPYALVGDARHGRAVAAAAR